MEISNVLIALSIFTALVGGAIWIGRVILRSRARAVGYEHIGVYLRAVPATDEQKMDAVDLTLKGVIITILGVIFAPLIIVGLIPLYYGIRKIVLALMGLGLTENLPA